MGSNTSKQRAIKEEIRNLNAIADHFDELQEYLRQKKVELPTRLLNNANIDTKILRNISLSKISTSHS